MLNENMPDCIASFYLFFNLILSITHFIPPNALFTTAYIPSLVKFCSKNLWANFRYIYQHGRQYSTSVQLKFAVETNGKNPCLVVPHIYYVQEKDYI